MSNDLVVVGEYEFVADADAARLLLEAEEIRAFLDDEHFVLGTAVVAKVLVAAGDEPLARQLLQRWDEARLARDHAAATAIESDDDASDGEVAESVTCLSCQATIPGGSAVCPACGWTYEATPADSSPGG